MIMTIEELKSYINTKESDTVLEAKLQALELLVRKYTNNNFQQRSFRSVADIVGNTIECKSLPRVKEGDTIQISDTLYNDGLYTVETIKAGVTITVKEDIVDETDVLLTKIDYPMDVKMGVVNMLKWDLENRNKVGIQSETISRHSVTYFNMDGNNSSIGYPKSLTGFLEPYRKARF